MKVTIIQRNANSVLVGWHDGAQARRAWLPKAAVREDAGGAYGPSYAADQPELGAPHGAPWAELLGTQLLGFEAADIEAVLHQYNIWTVADLERHTTVANAALMSLVAPVIIDLLRAARSHRQAQS